MVFFLKSRWEAQGQSPAPCPWGATAILSTLFARRTHRCCTEWGSKEKRVFSWPVALHFGEWGGKWEFSMVLCNPLGSWVIQWLPRLRQQTHPEAGKQARSVQARTMPLQSDTEAALFFPGTLTVRWKGSWRYLEGLPASWESRSWQLHLMQIHLESHNCPEKSSKWGLWPDQAAGVTSALTGSSSPRFSWGSRFWAIQIHDS